MIRVGSTVTMLRTYAADIADPASPKILRGAAVTVTRVERSSWSSRVRVYTVSDGATEIGPLPAHVITEAA